MNIFYLHDDPQVCAQYHNDKHVNKMLIESVQLLSNALNLLGRPAPYKLTHKNHPCSIWVRENRNNYKWLWYLAYNLGLEFRVRYGHEHKCFSILNQQVPLDTELPAGNRTTHPNCTPYKEMSDILAAYRRYYIEEKARFSTWKTNRIPEWYLRGLEEREVLPS
jgi:hypothetical protein